MDGCHLSTRQKHPGVYRPDNIASSLDYVPCTLAADGSCSNRTGYRFGTYAVNDADYRATAYSSPYVSTNPPMGKTISQIIVPATTVFLTEVVNKTTTPPSLQKLGTLASSCVAGGVCVAPFAHTGGTNVLWAAAMPNG